MTSPCHLYVAPRHIKDLLEAFSCVFLFKLNEILCGEHEKRIHYLCAAGIEKSVPHDHYL